MRNLIMLPAVVIILISVYFTMKGASKPRRNILFGITLPNDVINNNIIQSMISEYKKMVNKYCLLSALSGLPIIFIKKFSVETIYLLIWASVISYWVVNYPYKKMNRRLKLLKEENGWYVGEKRVVCVDTKLLNLKSKMPISDKYMLIPILISLIPILLSSTRADGDLKYLIAISVINILIVISMYLFGFRNIKKSKLKVYSKNTDINYSINKEEKYLNSIMWFMIAMLNSIIYLFVYFLVFDIISIGYKLITFIAIVGSLSLALGYIYINNRMIKLEEELSRIDTQTIYTDDDEYWIDGYKYYNENDKTVTVTPRYGMGYTYNMATKKGKMSTYGVLAIVGIIIIPVCITILDMDFSKPKIAISKESGEISVDYPSYDYSFNIKDIEEIKLVDDIKFKLKTNGIGTDDYSRGNYKSSEYGSCKVYIYKESKPYIVVKLKDKYFIYNEEKKEETMKIYKEISSLIK